MSEWGGSQGFSSYKWKRFIFQEEIIKWAKDNMANYKVPREIEFLDSLPVNAAGKIMKFKLR